jgi:hypothetical protein
MESERTRIVELTRDEVWVLTDRLSVLETGPDEHHLDPYALLLKLASAYLELVRPEPVTATRTAFLALTRTEVVCLRHKVNSQECMTADKYFGIKLLRKLYAALLSFENEVPGVEAGDHPGQTWTKDETKQALKGWEGA